MPRHPALPSPRPLGATRRRLLLAGGSVLLLSAAGQLHAQPVPAEVNAALPGARLQGSARLRVWGFHVYDARLWVGERDVADGDAGWVDVPLALELQYARALVGRQIAERSLQEMRRQGTIAEADGQRWLARMTELFPDVTENDRITGVHQPGRGASFFVNGEARGEVADTTFARLFFGIWLSPRTSEPRMRDSLLGTGR